MTRGPCLCGDTDCPSCGRAQGTYRERERPDPDEAYDIAASDAAFAERVIVLVRACDGERIDERFVRGLLNIEEDEQGADVVTYVCPRCGNVHRSRRYG